MDIIMDEEYVQKLGAERFNNVPVLLPLNVAVTWYIHAKTSKAIDAFPVYAYK